MEVFLVLGGLLAFIVGARAFQERATQRTKNLQARQEQSHAPAGQIVASRQSEATNGFDSYITPHVAQFLFVLLIVASILGGIFVIAASDGEGGIIAMGIGIMLLGPLVARLLTEGAVVVFQIHSTLTRIDAKLGRLGSIAEHETLSEQHDRQLQREASEMQTRPSGALPHDAPHS